MSKSVPRTIRSTCDIVHAGARSHPERTAIVACEFSRSFSYSELACRIDAAVLILKKAGLRSGDRLAYLGRNSDNYYILLFAAMRAGFVMVGLNWRCVASEISFFLVDCQAKLVFCDPEFREAVEDAMAERSFNAIIISTESRDGSRSLPMMLDLEVGCDDATVDERNAGPCLLLYTSGTTGPPKGVEITARALTQMRNIEFAAEGFPGGEDETYLISVPSFHMGGLTLVMLGLARSATCVLTADPSPANQIKICEKHGITITWMVPTMVRDFVEYVSAQNTKLPKLHTIMYGGAPITPELLSLAISQLGCQFSNAYGMTEIAGSATLLPPSDHLIDPRLLKSIGRAMPGVDCEIRDAHGNPLSPGTSGEIWIRTPTLMSGYWNRPEATRSVIEEGWYRTGDGGYQDSEGYIFLTDRIQDMIVSGGENVYPGEVENILRAFPGVADAVVVGIKDARWGELVTAVIESCAGQVVDPSAIMDHTRKYLAAFKCPRKVHVVQKLPRTASGKVQRKTVRELLLKSDDPSSL